METEDAEVHFALDHFNEDHSKEVRQLIDNLPAICIGDDHADQIARERSLERCIYILDLYQEQPHLLDPAIPSFVEILQRFVRTSFAEGNHRLFFQSFHFLRQFIKVRGYKTFARFLPHDHSDLMPVLCMLEDQRRLNAGAETSADLCMAEYVLLIWMSMLCKIPFDFSRFDHDAGESEKAQISTSQRIYNAVTPCLLTKDQRSEAAAYCLSIFVVRPDSIGRYLRPLLFDDILTLLDEAHNDFPRVQDQYGASLEHVISARCLLLASVLKRVKREEIPYNWANIILEKVLAYSSTLGESKNILIRKLTTKIVVRAALTMLKPRVASWRYDRGSRSLAVTLSAAQAGADLATTGATGNGEMEDDQFENAEDIEAVINYLLSAAKDKDTICRWSAAKGFGRLCARLPRELADQVVSALLTFFDSDFADASRHGACLALAELGRRGLLLPSRLDQVVPLIVRSLTYDEQRGTYSVGANVRDAACYVCWSFARAYAPSELRPYNLQLAIGLLTTAVFDREVNCRRAASAAFQEHVGRQRAEFPHGIELLTAVDYFAVGSRKRCYCELSRFVAGFPEYCHPMIDHVIEQKISHWDETIRELAGDALRELSSTDPTYVSSTVIPKLILIAKGSDLFACHGSVLALGRSSSVLCHLLSASANELISIPSALTSGRLYKGVGGEMIRKALNDYIYHICPLISSAIPDQQELRLLGNIFQNILDENLTHRREEIRQGARQSLEALFTAVAPLREDVIHGYVQQMENASYERQRAGAAFGLSALPRSVISENRDKILGVLTRLSIVRDSKTSLDSSWALARRDSLLALATAARKLGLDCGDGLTLEECTAVIECYVKALDDYTNDSRGDIGSLVREAAVAGAVELFSQILSSTSNRVNVNEDLSTKAIGKILQQCCEKIDRTRELACQSVEKLIREAKSADQLAKLRFPRTDILVNTFIGDNGDWTKADQSYPRLIGLLNAGNVFAYPVLLGFALTVGSMTESTVRSSSGALLTYMGKIKDQHEDLRLIIDTLISIFADHRKIDRMALPLMKTIDQLLNSNYFDNFLQQDDDERTLNQLLDLCIDEARLSKNSQKVLIGLSVCSSFLRYEGSAVAGKALTYGLSMLKHPYPRVRREAASQLYESVMSYFSLDNHNELALSLLSETDWDAEPKALEECVYELGRMLKAGT